MIVAFDSILFIHLLYLIFRFIQVLWESDIVSFYMLSACFSCFTSVCMWEVKVTS